MRTQGPWTDDGDGTILGPNGGVVCTVAWHGNHNTVVREGEHYNYADAKLIIASTDLLAAAKDMLQWSGRGGPPPGEGYFARLRAAIEKAGG